MSPYLYLTGNKYNLPIVFLSSTRLKEDSYLNYIISTQLHGKRHESNPLET